MLRVAAKPNANANHPTTPPTVKRGRTAVTRLKAASTTRRPWKLGHSKTASRTGHYWDTVSSVIGFQCVPASCLLLSIRVLYRRDMRAPPPLSLTLTPKPNSDTLCVRGLRGEYTRVERGEGLRGEGFSLSLSVSLSWFRLSSDDDSTTPPGELAAKVRDICGSQIC